MARPTLRLHPKFRRLMYLLSLPEPYALGLLECLWEVAYASGDERIGDAVDVELAACWPGEKGMFCKTMLDCGFLDTLPDGSFAVHDLWDHAPEYVKARARRESARQAAGKSLSDVKREAANKRWSNANDMQTNASEIHLHNGAMQTHANETTPSPTPSPTPSQEDKCSAEVASQPSALPVMTFPCKGTGKKEWHLTAEKLSEYVESFPGIDVLAECRKARQWCIDNTKNRKTPPGMPAFLGRWLGNNQNRAPVQQKVVKAFVTPPADPRTPEQKAADLAADRKRVEADKAQAASAAELLAKLRGIGTMPEENP